MSPTSTAPTLKPVPYSMPDSATVEHQFIQDVERLAKEYLETRDTDMELADFINWLKKRAKVAK